MLADPMNNTAHFAGGVLASSAAKPLIALSNRVMSGRHGWAVRSGVDFGSGFSTGIEPSARWPPAAPPRPPRPPGPAAGCEAARAGTRVRQTAAAAWNFRVVWFSI